MKKIVITGGPCAGKTTAIEFIKKDLTEKGYLVLCIPETATELICGGVTPWGMKTLDYQLCQMKLQLYKEAVYEEAAKKIGNTDKTVIICDRGMMDNKAYMSESELSEAFKILELTTDNIMKRYDCIIHLETAAKSEGYTLSNNSARTENKEQAIVLDEALFKAWETHPSFNVIRSTRDFNEKIASLSALIYKLIL
ncbi:MAG: hypothetical protein E7411_03735 [Ruminococcaceae bacterium]|nr:hypothetical protein [Oscillospiraceae bacterium]